MIFHSPNHFVERVEKNKILVRGGKKDCDLDPEILEFVGQIMRYIELKE